MHRPGVDEVMLGVAECIALRGTCSRKQVGAVLSHPDARIIVPGFNGAPAGLKHCDHSNEPDRRCSIAVHAEANAVISAAKYGVSTQGATLYVTLQPCLGCSGLMINAGVTRIVYGENYRDDGGIDHLRSAGVVVERVNLYG